MYTSVYIYTAPKTEQQLYVRTTLQKKSNDCWVLCKVQLGSLRNYLRSLSAARVRVDLALVKLDLTGGGETGGCHSHCLDGGGGGSDGHGSDGSGNGSDGGGGGSDRGGGGSDRGDGGSDSGGGSRKAAAMVMTATV